MTEQKKERPVWELVGKVNRKITKETLPKTKQKALEEGKKVDDYSYRLVIACENLPQVTKLCVFKDRLISERIWKDIEESNYAGKRYLFYTIRGMYGSYLLINWRELKND